MDIQKILAAVDHALLRPEATWEEIRQICEDGAAFGCASVCIPPSFVKRAADCLGDKLPVCTVIGFPNGYSTTAVKALEAADAVANGAQEIDMVINIGWVKDHLWNDILREIQAVKEACSGRVLKVIVETCLLTREEKVKLCQIVSDSGADFIKTSTGFSAGGATRERGLVQGPCGLPCENQSGWRYLQPPGCGRIFIAGRGSPGYQPHCEAGEGSGEN